MVFVCRINVKNVFLIVIGYGKYGWDVYIRVDSLIGV